MILHLERFISQTKKSLGIRENFFPKDGLASFSVNNPRMLKKIAEKTGDFKSLVKNADTADLSDPQGLAAANFEAHYLGVLEKNLDLGTGTLTGIDRDKPMRSWRAEADLNVYDSDMNLLHGLIIYAANFSVITDGQSVEAGDLACMMTTEDSTHRLIFTRFGNRYKLTQKSVSLPERNRTAQGEWCGSVDELNESHDPQLLLVLDALRLPQNTYSYLIQPMKQAVSKFSSLGK
jgi:hypothetical protein